MNCVELFVKRAHENPGQMALTLLRPSGIQPSVNFGQLLELSAKAQGLCKARGVRPGDAVLLLEPLSIRLFASVIGLLASGASVILVEPWMPIAKIERVIGLVNPKLFLSSGVGFAWGARISAVRKIPRWTRISGIDKFQDRPLELVDVDPNSRGILTFTSGTTGEPKGVVRGQDYLLKQHEILSRALRQDEFKGPDLCVFANFALMNLASGRGSLMMPAKWKPKTLKRLDTLAGSMAPETLTCGPAFLIELMKYAKLPSLKSAHVGGALTDCWIFEEAFEKWPEAHWSHVYGGSEVEPVAEVDARIAVSESRKAQLFQTLYLGKPVPEIESQPLNEGLWVAGPHVCPEYVGNEAESKALKRKDSNGRLWHFMGDRIETKGPDHPWWYGGRSGQAIEDFKLEQKIYAELNSSKSFILRKKDGSRWLVGEGLESQKDRLQSQFPELAGIAEARIQRDPRHRARIDRIASLKKGPTWLAG